MRWLTALLTWFAADPQAIDTERPKAAAAGQVAYCSMAKEIKDDAAEDQDASAALGEPGAGLAAEAGHNGPQAAGNAIHEQGAPAVAAGCTDGKCVAVPRVRQGRR